MWRAQDGGRGMEGRVFPGRSVSICDILIDILLSLERMLRLKNFYLNSSRGIVFVTF